jgi:hypothetical protein
MDWRIMMPGAERIEEDGPQKSWFLSLKLLKKKLFIQLMNFRRDYGTKPLTHCNRCESNHNFASHYLISETSLFLEGKRIRKKSLSFMSWELFLSKIDKYASEFRVGFRTESNRQEIIDSQIICWKYIIRIFSIYYIA